MVKLELLCLERRAVESFNLIDRPQRVKLIHAASAISDD
jgi:hypothetical protein